MTNNTKIIWRLKELPTPSELKDLVASGIMSKDEARTILFSSQTEEDRDKKSLESEIKFLRELVERLSNNSNVKIIETIREVERPWKIEKWYKPYEIYCMNSVSTAMLDGQTSYTLTGISQGGTSDFSNIKTF